MKNPHYKDESEGRVRRYYFNWIGGGYNTVWARNEYDAIVIANGYFGGGTADLRVNESTVKDVTDWDAYAVDSLHGCWD